MSDVHRETVHNAPRLFATAAELGVPPVPPRDADLSRIRVLDRDSPEGQEELRKRAERKAKRDRIDGTGDLAGLLRAEAVTG